jgi:hypothetical protein
MARPRPESPGHRGGEEGADEAAEAHGEEEDSDLSLGLGLKDHSRQDHEGGLHETHDEVGDGRRDRGDAQARLLPDLADSGDGLGDQRRAFPDHGRLVSHPSHILEGPGGEDEGGAVDEEAHRRSGEQVGEQPSDQRSQGEGCLDRGGDERVGVGQTLLGDQRRDHRVEGGVEQRGHRADDEGHREDGPDPVGADTGRQIEEGAGPEEVGGDHHRAEVDPVEEHTTGQADEEGRGGVRGVGEGEVEGVQFARRLLDVQDQERNGDDGDVIAELADRLTDPQGQVSGPQRPHRLHEVHRPAR